jgi:hypothetical protein
MQRHRQGHHPQAPERHQVTNIDNNAQRDTGVCPLCRGSGRIIPTRAWNDGPSRFCPHPTPPPDGVCDACRGVAVEPVKAPCPHARPDWRQCPHCLGVNLPQPLPLSTTTATGGPFVIGDASTVEYMRKRADPARGDDAALREEIRDAGVADVAGDDAMTPTTRTEGAGPMDGQRDADSALLEAVAEAINSHPFLPCTTPYQRAYAAIRTIRAYDRAKVPSAPWHSSPARESAANALHALLCERHPLHSDVYGMVDNVAGSLYSHGWVPAAGTATPDAAHSAPQPVPVVATGAGWTREAFGAALEQSRRFMQAKVAKENTPPGAAIRYSFCAADPLNGTEAFMAEDSEGDYALYAAPGAPAAQATVPAGGESDGIAHAIMASAPWYAVNEDGRARVYFERPNLWQGPLTGRWCWLGSIAAECGTVSGADWRDSLRRYDADKRVWVKP